MPTQTQIDRYTLAFHRLAVARLRENPSLLNQATAVLDRWEASGLSPASGGYRREWRELLGQGVDRLALAVCVESSHAATLRSMSPLGFLLEEQERLQVRREAMAA